MRVMRLGRCCSINGSDRCMTPSSVTLFDRTSNAFWISGLQPRMSETEPVLVSSSFTLLLADTIIIDGEITTERHCSLRHSSTRIALARVYIHALPQRFTSTRKSLQPIATRQHHVAPTHHISSRLIPTSPFRQFRLQGRKVPPK